MINDILKLISILGLIFLGYHFINYLKVTRGTEAFAKRKAIFYLFSGLILIGGISSILADSICDLLSLNNCQSFQYLTFAAYIVFAIASVKLFNNTDSKSVSNVHHGSGDVINNDKVQGDKVQGDKIINHTVETKNDPKLNFKIEELVDISKYFQVKDNELDYFRHFDIHEIIEINGKQIVSDYRSAFFNKPVKFIYSNKTSEAGSYGMIEYCKQPQGRVRTKEAWKNFTYCNLIVPRKYMDAMKELTDMENSVLLDDEITQQIRGFKSLIGQNLRLIRLNLIKYAKEELPQKMKTDRNLFFDVNYGLGAKEGYSRLKKLAPKGKEILNKIKSKLT